MSFKKMRGVRVPYNSQGLIYFICKNYYSQPQNVRDYIDSLCVRVGGIYAAELKLVVTSGASVRNIALKHCISEPTLYRLRKEFYEAWNFGTK